MTDTSYTSSDIKFSLINPEKFKSDFIPWTGGETGQQSFLKLKKGAESALFYVGTSVILQPEIHKSLMKLINEGWKPEGKVDIFFDGKAQPDIDILFERDLITLELGVQLLPLVDPQQGAPLLEKLTQMRRELSEEIGFITPGIKIKDNLRILPQEYVLRIKETPIIKGEIYLDRYLVMGEAEKLSELKGWTTTEPTYKIPAKWIETDLLSEAEKKQCMILGPLNVMLTHIKENLRQNLRHILGLQETRFLLERLAQTHPVVAEDFLKDNNKLRKLRIILHNLLAEHVSIRDLLTITETAGDNLDKIDKIDLVTEFIRLSLARQICSGYLDQEGKLNVFCFTKDSEQKLLKILQQSGEYKYLSLTQDDVGTLITAVKNTLKDSPEVRVILVPPPLRIYLKRILTIPFPWLVLLSTAEITEGVNLRVAKEIDVPIKEKASTKKPWWRLFS